MKKLFGTDGIRGIANTYPMTPEMMVKIGLVVGSMLEEKASGILIGRDSRLSGPLLESALTAGILSAGTDVLLAGILPTPAIAFLTRNLQAHAGVVISASHNPAQDNGIKFFAQDGVKLSDELEVAIENRVLAEQMPAERPTGADKGKKVDGDQIMAILALDLFHKRQLKNNILVTTVMSNLGKSLSALAACMQQFPQTLVNLPVKSRKPLEDLIGVSQAIHRAEQELGERGRVLVRYSGTELLARVMVEAEQEDIVKRIAETIAEEIRKENH